MISDVLIILVSATVFGACVTSNFTILFVNYNTLLPSEVVKSMYPDDPKFGFTIPLMLMMNYSSMAISRRIGIFT
jgi:hypothetical protein